MRLPVCIERIVLFTIATVVVGGCAGTPDRPQTAVPKTDIGTTAITTMPQPKREAAAPVLALPPIPDEPAKVSQNDQDLYAQAVNMLEVGDALRAEAILQELADSYPGHAGPVLNLAIIYARDGRTAEAKLLFVRALELRPDNAIAYNQLGILARRNGEFNAAQANYEQAVALAPDYAFAHLNLGVLYEIYLQQPEQALPHYERYQELTGSEDEQVSGWIADLQLRLQSRSQTAQVQ